MQIETNQYEFAHGKKPRGMGYWAFVFSVPASIAGGASRLTEFAPSTMSYAEAKKWAQARARDLKAARVEVGS